MTSLHMCWKLVRSLHIYWTLMKLMLLTPFIGPHPLINTFSTTMSRSLLELTSARGGLKLRSYLKEPLCPLQPPQLQLNGGHFEKYHKSISMTSDVHGAPWQLRPARRRNGQIHAKCDTLRRISCHGRNHSHTRCEYS